MKGLPTRKLKAGMPAQRGISLVELMVACTLGLLIILAATGLLLASRQTYLAIDEQIAVQETGHYALAILARSARQAAWTAYSSEAGTADTGFPPGIIGLEAKSLRMSSEDIENPIATISHGSDVLAIRFRGANDGSMLNCAGFAVSADGEDLQGWSIFCVGGDRHAEPELRCKYRGKSSWRTEGIARGIESFQVLYGIDTDADGLPNQFLNARGIEQLNEGLDVHESDSDSDESEASEAGIYWSKVVALKIAILVRGSRNVDEAGAQPPYHLFGMTYSSLHGAGDQGTFIQQEDIPQAVRPRLRKVFTVTIPLRNSALEIGT